MTHDDISIVERAIRKTEKRVEAEIATWLRSLAPDSPIDEEKAIRRLAAAIESGDYKK